MTVSGKRGRLEEISARNTLIKWATHPWFAFLLFSSFLYDMYLLPDVSLKAILKDWHPQKYNPPCTDVEEWTHSIELLCDAYGIPDVQRSECATCFVKDRFATELLGVLSVARETYGPLRWDQFKSLMVVIDGKRDPVPKTLTYVSLTEVLREQWKSKLPLFIMPWPIPTRSPLDRTSILQQTPQTRRNCSSGHRWHVVGTSCCQCPVLYRSYLHRWRRR